MNDIFNQDDLILLKEVAKSVNERFIKPLCNNMVIENEESKYLNPPSITVQLGSEEDFYFIDHVYQTLLGMQFKLQIHFLENSNTILERELKRNDYVTYIGGSTSKHLIIGNKYRLTGKPRGVGYRKISIIIGTGKAKLFDIRFFR